MEPDAHRGKLCRDGEGKAVSDWKKVKEFRWERGDGCVVKIDTSAACSTSRPWLPHYRGWMAFGPGTQEHNYLGYYRKDSAMHIPRKFKTAEMAMRAVDRQHPRPL